MGKNNKITVLGGGVWGTVLAGHLSRDPRREVRLWEFFPEFANSLAKSRRHPHIPGFRLNEAVAVTSDLGASIERAEVLLFALPSIFVRRTARKLKPLLRRGKATVVVNLSKGVEPRTLLTMGEVIAAELPRGLSVYTLSGPSFAREVARGVPTKMLLAGPDGPQAATLLRLFNGGALSVAWSPDRKGVELGGSLKNVLAIGCGILDGLKAGANTKAALIVQGLSEMSKLIRRRGGRPETIYGLAGLGDLIATGTSPESRNRAFGEKLGAGKTVAEALSEIPTVVEGLEAAGSAHALARRLAASTPLLDAIWGAVRRGGPVKSVLRALGFND